MNKGDVVVPDRPCDSYRRRRRQLVRMRSSQSQLSGRSTTQTVRLESRMFRVTQLWSWQERLRRETKLRRYSEEEESSGLNSQMLGRLHHS